MNLEYLFGGTMKTIDITRINAIFARVRGIRFFRLGLQTRLGVIVGLICVFSSLGFAQETSRLLCRWRNEALKVEGNKVVGSTSSNDQWYVEKTGEGNYVRIKHSPSGNPLNIEKGVLTASPINDAAWSAQWTLVPVSGGYFRIVNRWKNTAINNEKGPLEVSDIQAGAFSAQWTYAPETATGRLTSGGKHVYTNKILMNREKSVDGVAGNQQAQLQLKVIPNIHVSKTGRRVIVFDMGDSLIKEIRSGGLNVNNSKSRGWFYEKVDVTIENSDNVRLVAVPKVLNSDEGQMTSTVENTFGVDLGGSADGPSAGVNSSSTESKSFSRTVRGFTLDPPTAVGRLATHSIRMTGCLQGENGGLKPYAKWQDLTDQDEVNSFGAGFASVFNGKLYSGFNVNALTDPALGRGLYLPVQAVYDYDASATGMATFTVRVKLYMRWVYAEGETKLDGKIKTQTKTLTYSDIPVTVNLDMNAYK